LADEDKPIKVSDFRMFTPEGDLRPEYRDLADAPAPAAEPAAAPAAPEPAAAAATPEPLPAEGPATDPQFLELIRSIATSAYAALGFLAEPGTPVRADLAGARRVIEWIGALERKSRNNLSFEEQDMLARALYELQMAFVEASGPPRGRPAGA
jgi:hypothetical protein